MKLALQQLLRDRENTLLELAGVRSALRHSVDRHDALTQRRQQLESEFDGKLARAQELAAALGEMRAAGAPGVERLLHGNGKTLDIGHFKSFSGAPAEGGTTGATGGDGAQEAALANAEALGAVARAEAVLIASAERADALQQELAATQEKLRAVEQARRGRGGGDAAGAPVCSG